MKRMIWLILIALAAMLIFAGCRKTPGHDTDDIDGAVRSDTGYDAPKEIESTEIKSFYCEFSNYGLVDEETYLENRIYTLKASLKDDVVQGSYQIYGRGPTTEEEFETTEEFLDEVQKIVKDHNLVKNNGLSYKISGLPDQYGAVLEVEYESGERIYASHNQDNFLSIETMEALEKLFRKQFEDASEEGQLLQAIDLTVSKQLLMENVNGRYVTLEYPVMELGYETPGGKWLNTDGYPALEEALSVYNKEEWDFHAGSRSTLRSAAKNLEGESESYRELYTCTDAYVTRNDTRVLSFYTFTRHFEGWIPEMYDWETRNFDVETGKILSFEEVFTDLEELSRVAAAEIKAAYPNQQFLDEIEQLIYAGMSKNEGILFALSYDCVHILAENQYLSYENTEGQHIVLSFGDYPEIVKEAYRANTKNWMVNLDFRVDHPLINELKSKDEWEYTPETYLICRGEQQFLFLRVPTGDVTLLTKVYEVTEDGLILVDEIEGAIHDETNFHPDHIKMYEAVNFDEMELGEALPFGIYSVGEDGYPVLNKEVEF